MTDKKQIKFADLDPAWQAYFLVLSSAFLGAIVVLAKKEKQPIELVTLIALETATKKVTRMSKAKRLEELKSMDELVEKGIKSGEKFRS